LKITIRRKLSRAAYENYRHRLRFVFFTSERRLDDRWRFAIAAFSTTALDSTSNLSSVAGNSF
jgi:hypothetical protein